MAESAPPVMTDLAIKFDFDGITAEQGPPVWRRTYPAATHDLFAGEQLVLVGRYKKFGAAKIVVSGKVGSEDRKFDFPATFVEKSGDDTNAFIEKLWAVRRVGEIIDEIDLKGKNDELVKELVQLSTKHGILTPYTSFLADETTDRRDFATNAKRARLGLEKLETAASGEAGFSQRRAKNLYQNADRLSSSFGGSGGLPGAATSAPRYADAAKDREVTVNTLQNVGRKSFYRSGERWVDSSVTKEQEAHVIKIERYSKEYFDLVDKHGKEIAKYLLFDEPVTFEIDGQAYSF